MNIMIEQCCNSCANTDFFMNLYDDNFTLIRDGYKFYIDEEHVDYPLIDSDIWKGIVHDLDLLKYLRQS